MEERLGRLLVLTAKVVREQFDQDLAAVGSSLNTYVILHNVETRTGVSQRQLATHLGIEGPTLTHHLDRLAAEQLITRVRNPEDRRVHHVELTEAGRAHLERVEAHAQGLDRDLRSLFSPAEAEALSELLTRVRDRYTKEADVHAAR
jgi:MarR family transcriptional regulator for hemolysin